jgi:hypothetical protein
MLKFSLAGLVSYLLVGCSNLIGADEVVFDETEACSGKECAEAQLECSGDACQLCRGASCVALLNDDVEVDGLPGDCRKVVGAEGLKPGAKTFLFGALTWILEGEQIPSPYTLNYEFALKEFASRGGVTVQGEDRQPVAVLCHAYAATPEALDRTFDHLVDDLGVPAIVAPLPAADLKRSFERIHARGKDVFFLSPFESDSLLTNVVDDGLLWHMTANTTAVGQAYLPLIARAVKHAGQRPDGLRVALVDSDLASQADMGAVVHAGMHFNGKPASENDSEHYLRLRLDSVRSDPGASVTEEFLKLLDFEPDIIVAAGGNEFLLRVWQPLELTLKALPADEPRPFYVLSPYQAANPGAVVGLVEAVPDLRTRAVGVNVAAAEDLRLYDEYLSAFQASYSEYAEYLPGTENFYDSVYFLLYAVSAARNAPRLTGKEVANGMLQLLDGPPVNVGPNQIPDVKAMLAVAGGRVALQGTLGPPDFDASTGARQGVGSAWCVDEGPVVHYDALRYDKTSKTLDGELPCFEGFPSEP